MKRSALTLLMTLLLGSSGCFGLFGGGDDDASGQGGGTCSGNDCGIDTGRLDLQGLSVQLVETYSCEVDAEPAACGDYVIRFTLENGTDLSIEELNQVEMASPTTLIARTPFSTCTDSAHTPSAHQRSQVIELRLGWASFDFPSSSFCHGSFSLEPALPAPSSGDVLITVRGIFEDASPFEVTASASIQNLAP